MKTIIISVLIVFIVMGCTGKQTSKSNEQPEPEVNASQSEGEPATVKPSSETFNSKCSACHGTDGTAGIAGAANLKISRLGKEDLIKVISNGRNAMPGFSTQLSKKEIEALSGYVQTLRKN